ncbi:permease [Nocardia goodfellowii]|uniref:Energy-converting hydrogenase Eha subunit C n=1 Tax=Nocardia goodfellowii TaxID=882446 RepID=A0ABS4QPK1_9NOCA|nr:permease [Nocardia goodfellowii]MBP2193634.1 energy-converting hydrogenase Eha subunit C [Nocardia goodfellowii]
MTMREGQPTDTQSHTSNWRSRLFGSLALVAVLVVTYLILKAFIPRWWAQRLAESIHGSFSKGIWWGLLLGGLCTLVPLLLLLFAANMWRRRGGKFIAGAAAVLGIIVALPNLMTLAIVRGGSNAAHAGERILDVDAPAFRGATLVGVLLAIALFVLIAIFDVRRGWRRRRAAEMPPADTTYVDPDTTTTRHEGL